MGLTWTGPVGGVPYRSCLNPRSSLYLDLDALGYVEQEWFVAGSADAVGADGQVVADAAPFETRCLVRRPAGEASGVAYVEPFHALDEDTPSWSNSWRHLVRNRHTWVGVTTTTGAFSLDGRPGAGGLARLQRFDRGRYDRLHLFDPGVIGERVSLGSDGRIRAQARRSAGLLDMQSADILAQVAVSLRPGMRQVIAVGFSQTAGTWARFLHGSNHGFDGYVLAVSGPPPRCREDAVVVTLLSESEAVGTLVEPISAPDDRDSPRFRAYEVPGSFHYWTVKATREIDHGQRHSDKPWDVLYHAILSNLEAWCGGGAPMPRAARVERDNASRLVRDFDGNLVGGLRAAWLDVPDGTYSGRCSCSPVMGRFEPFSEVEMARRYGASYQQQLRKRAEELIAERWLLAEDLERALGG